MVGRGKGGAGSARGSGGRWAPPRRLLLRYVFLIVLYAPLNLIVIVCWLLSGSLFCNSTSITSFIARVPPATLRLKTRFPFSPGATRGSSTKKDSPPQRHAGRG